MQFQDLVELLQLNKDIKGLAKYMSEHVLTTLNAENREKIGEVVKCLKTRYGRTRLEKIEELVSKLMSFRYDDFDDEDDLLQVMVEIQRRKILKVLDKEWHMVWMLRKVQKRRGMEHFQYQTLRDILKVEGDKMKEFVENYREVKVQTSR